MIDNALVLFALASAATAVAFILLSISKQRQVRRLDVLIDACRKEKVAAAEELAEARRRTKRARTLLLRKNYKIYLPNNFGTSLG